MPQCVANARVQRTGRARQSPHREAIGRQQMVPDCGDGLAGQHRLERQEALAVVRAQPVSRENIRRQIIIFFVSMGVETGANRI